MLVQAPSTAKSLQNNKSDHLSTHPSHWALPIQNQTRYVVHIPILNAAIEAHMDVFVEFGFDILKTIYTHCGTGLWLIGDSSAWPEHAHQHMIRCLDP